ncbi:MAG: peptidase S41 [Undibacterium sp.]|nr:peptidase S41 [Undibacterium sp.]
MLSVNLKLDTPKSKHKAALGLGTLMCALLSACGGGGGPSYNTPMTNVPVVTNPTTPTTLPPSESLINLCKTPAPNTSDRQGTKEQEKAYLRSFIDETYLWYRDVPQVNPASYDTPQTYFDVLKTNKTTASGRPVDEFHWSVTSESFDNQNQGIEEGYGIEWATAQSSPPRDWVVASLQPAAPAGTMLKRGDKIKSVDGEDFVSGENVDKLNEGLFPTKIAPHTIEVIRAGKVLSFTITPALVETTPVRYTKVITTPTGKVGYIYFDDHISKSEPMLIAAINSLKAQGAQDLILDLRYNGGGLLSIASRLAYMIGGTQTTGKTFENLVYNDKQSAQNDKWPFLSYASSDAGGADLPSLNFKKVSILVGGGTASASEAIINGLRGVDVEVTLIGGTTRGKPYGFVPQENCGWVYYAIQFKGENNKGFSDFSDGFKPTCAVKDDFTKDLGDVTEARFAAALQYRETKTCPVSSGLVAGSKGGGLIEYQVAPKIAKQLMIPK